MSYLTFSHHHLPQSDLPSFPTPRSPKFPLQNMVYTYPLWPGTTVNQSINKSTWVNSKVIQITDALHVMDGTLSSLVIESSPVSLTAGTWPWPWRTPDLDYDGSTTSPPSGDTFHTNGPHDWIVPPQSAVNCMCSTYMSLIQSAGSIEWKLCHLWIGLK